MATCKTCGRTIAVPEGWSVGPAVRKHYWEQHPERMEKTRADRSAEATLPSPEGLPLGGGRRAPGQPNAALMAPVTPVRTLTQNTDGRRMPVR